MVQKERRGIGRQQGNLDNRWLLLARPKGAYEERCVHVGSVLPQRWLRTDQRVSLPQQLRDGMNERNLVPQTPDQQVGTGMGPQSLLYHWKKNHCKGLLSGLCIWEMLALRIERRLVWTQRPSFYQSNNWSPLPPVWYQLAIIYTRTEWSITPIRKSTLAI